MLRLTNGEIESIEDETGVELKQRQGRPLFLTCVSTCKGGKENICFQLDGGADRTIISMQEAIRLKVKLRKFNNNQSIIGVEGREIACSRFAILKISMRDLNGKTLTINILSYVFDKDIPNLLGSDVMSYMQAIINYKDETLTLEGYTIQLVSRWKRDRDERKEHKNLTFFSKMQISLPAKQCRQIYVDISDPGDLPDETFALLGDYGGDVVVLDSVWQNKRESYQMVVLNLADEPRTLKQGEKLVYVLLPDGDNEIISVDSLISDPVYFEKQVEGEGGGASEKEGQVDGAMMDERKRVGAQGLDAFYDQGIKIKLPEQELVEPTNVKLENIVKEDELKKNKADHMWKDKKEFLKIFKWDDMQKELEEDVGVEESKNFTERMKNLFFDYKNVFWDGKWENFPRANIPDLEIEVIEGAKPKIDKYRPMSNEKEQILKSFMADLVKAGVIEKSSGLTAFTANPHIVRERRETNAGYVIKYRYCLDYRNQNKVTKDIGYRLPLMEELLRKASSSGRYFMSFDLSSFFFQLPISERSKEITSFYLLNWGVYRWNRVPMGMKNSPGLAQITTDRVAKHMINALGYIDDFLLYGLDLEEIFRSAESFLMTMSHFNMVVGPQKVNLVSKKRNFLGYSVSQNQILRVTPNRPVT